MDSTTPLARLRPEKLNEAAIQEQIALIQKVCENVDPDDIAIILHECDYNIQATIARLNSGNYQDGGWQKAKPSHKKKHSTLVNDSIPNGNHSLDAERSSPTSSVRSEHRRTEPFQSTTRINTNKSPPVPSGSINQISNEVPSISLPTDENFNPNSMPSIHSLSTNDQTKFLTINEESNAKKGSTTSSVHSHRSKRRSRSGIPTEPVSMHPAIRLSTLPIDIQFGDVQWINSIPTAIEPSVVDRQEEEEQIPNGSSSTSFDPPTINKNEPSFIDRTNGLSINETSMSNGLPPTNFIVATNSASDVPDPSSSLSTQYQSEEPLASQISTTQSSSISTPRTSNLTSPTPLIHNPFPVGQTSSSSQETNPSVFTPSNIYGNYASIATEYPSNAGSWNPQVPAYKSHMKQTTPLAYSNQTLYQLPTASQQQQQQQPQALYLGNYHYQTAPPTGVQVMIPFDSWSNAGYVQSLESYPYGNLNYVSNYAGQAQYHQPTKYDQSGYDYDFYAHYGQAHSTNVDPSGSKQENAGKSKLSATAATFAHSNTTPTGFVPHYTYPMTGQYPTVESRDTRHGAPYVHQNARNNVYHHGQTHQQSQRNYPNNPNWHLQQ